MKIGLTELLAAVVATVWAVSFLADIFLTSYDPSPFLHLLMMTVVGSIFGQRFVKKENGDGHGRK